MAIRSNLRSNRDQEVIDLGLGDILRELNKADKSNTKVGYPAGGEVKSGTRKGSGRDPVDDISEIAEIAAFNEFGTATTPARSFVRSSFDENLQKINSLKARLYKRIIDGKITTRRALGIIGEAHLNQMKKKIRDIKEPANAPSTIRRKKGVNNPLIDTAQMLNSAQHVEEIRV